MDKSVTESELNTSEVTFKPGVKQTYERAGRASTDSPITPRKSARLNLFNLTDSNPGEIDTQETQNPNLFVADTEYTEYSEASQTIG